MQEWSDKDSDWPCASTWLNTEIEKVVSKMEAPWSSRVDTKCLSWSRFLLGPLQQGKYENLYFHHEITCKRSGHLTLPTQSSSFWKKVIGQESKTLGASWNSHGCCGGYSHIKQVRYLWKIRRVAALGFSLWKLEKPLKKWPSRTRHQPDTSQAFDRTGREPWAVWTSPCQDFIKLMIRVCGMPIHFKNICL